MACVEEHRLIRDRCHGEVPLAAVFWSSLACTPLSYDIALFTVPCARCDVPDAEREIAAGLERRNPRVLA